MLGRGWISYLPKYLSVITVIGWISRKGTETTLSHKRRVKGEYSPCSEGEDNNKYLYELEHTVSRVKCHYIRMAMSSVINWFSTVEIRRFPEDNLFIESEYSPIRWWARVKWEKIMSVEPMGTGGTGK